MSNELPIIQKTYDLILWYAPIIERLPRTYKFTLGERTINGLYELLEQLTLARYEKQKLARLEALNARLSILRYQTRLMFDFHLMNPQRYEYVSTLLNGIGTKH